jgi:hypothetical protein
MFPHGDPRAVSQARALEDVYALYPMGTRRAHRLINSKKIESFPDIDVNEPNHVPRIAYFEPTFRHFENEFDIYRAEWSSAHPAGRAIPGEPTDEYFKKRLPEDRYVERRWLETDEAAPHPDMDKVQAAIKKLEGPKRRK